MRHRFGYREVNHDRPYMKSLKFFIVDDDPFSRMLYQQHLVNLGFKDNVLFDNGNDCISKLNMQPDIIFLDYDMQPLNGLDVLTAVKKYNPNIQLLIISGHGDIEVASDAIKMGANDYIKKGDRDLELISEAISKILMGRGLN